MKQMANKLQDMQIMSVYLLGVSDTFCDGEEDFKSSMPDSEEVYRVIFSGGDKKRRGVGMILGENVRKSVLNYQLMSDRIMIMRLKPVPVNLLIVRVYAPC